MPYNKGMQQNMKAQYVYPTVGYINQILLSINQILLLDFFTGTWQLNVYPGNSYFNLLFSFLVSLSNILFIEVKLSFL